MTRPAGRGRQVLTTLPIGQEFNSVRPGGGMALQKSL